MGKITNLLKHGWKVEMMLNEADGWFGVSASHSFWGDVSEYAPTLSEAINKVYDSAIDLSD